MTRRNRCARYLRYIPHGSLNRQPLAFFYPRFVDRRLLVVNHRQHKGVAEQVANVGALLAEKVSDLPDFAREVKSFRHLHPGAIVGEPDDISPA